MPLLDEIAALQVAKIRCEIEKLQAETRLLPRFCWLQASYIGATLPIIAVFITGWITYSNSDWRRNAEKLQEQVATLRPEADKLRMQVTGLQKQADSLRSERARLLLRARTAAGPGGSAAID